MENCFTIANGKIVTPTQIIENGYISVVGKNIVDIGKMEDYDYDPNLEEDIIMHMVNIFYRVLLIFILML